MAPANTPGSTALWISRVPTFEYSGHSAWAKVPNRAARSEQATLPSAALELSEKPTGRVTVADLICDGEGVVGLWVCGTVRLMSRPEAVSACVVVGFAARLGLKPTWPHPVISGQGDSA